MKLLRDSLIDWQDGGKEPHIERVLHVSPSDNRVVAIRITKERVLPFLRTYEEIESAIANGLVHVLEDDPYAKLRRPDSDFSEKQLIKRDFLWNLISPLAEAENIEFLIDPNLRGPLIADLALKTGHHKKVIYDALRRFWQSGRIKNGLIKDSSGSPSKRRRYNEQDGRKLGRPSSLEKKTGQVIGIKITPPIEEKFKQGIKKFYETEEERTLTSTFDRIISTYFIQGYTLENDEFKPILLPASERPTFRQFQYWYKTYYRNVEREKKARHGSTRFELNDRAAMGDSTQMAFGPGSVYQIDSTLADVYLASSLDSDRIIGRPVVYMCMDVFSRAITGIAVTLEGPSWLGAMLALDNVTTDKVAFCREYGIVINESDWPCHHLMERILADRGEFEGYNANTLVNPLNVTIHNTPPYRADLKGIIEQNFRRTKEKVIRFLPGEVHTRYGRGAKDYRLDATMTLYRFTRLIIRYVIWYNNNYYLKRYNMDEFMIQDRVKRFPLELWDWGIRNRSGHLRTIQQDIMRLNLLPRKKVWVTELGIHFEKDLYYSCELAMREQWFLRAKDAGSWKVEVAYYPQCMDAIYLLLDGGRRLEPCHLTDRCKTFKGRNWYDITDYFELQNQVAQELMPRRQQSIAVLQSQQDYEVSEAKKEAVAKRSGAPRSRRSRLKGIRDNRRAEKEIERQKTSWRLDDSQQQENHPSPTHSDNQVDCNEDEEYVGPPRDVQNLQKIVEEVMYDD